MTTQEFKDGLCGKLEIPVYHVMAAPEDECPIVCWQELPKSQAFGDDTPVCSIASCQIDYYTVDEYDINPGLIEQAFQTLEVLYTFEAQTYDEDRNEWRYIWRVQFLGGGAGG